MHTLAKILPLALTAAVFISAPLAFAEPPIAAPAESAKSAVGLSSRDGISMSGTDVLVTRNGITEKMTKEMTLKGGVKVMPDGTVVGTDGSKTMLRADQVVTFDGKLMNTPVVEAVKPGTTAVPGTSAAGAGAAAK